MACRLKSFGSAKINLTISSARQHAHASLRSFTKLSRNIPTNGIKSSNNVIFASKPPNFAFSINSRFQLNHQPTKRCMTTYPVSSGDNISVTTKLQELILSVNTLWNRKSELSSSDFKQLFTLCTEAAKLGHRPSQFLLGNFYAQGVGTERNPKEAIHWWKEAAKMESNSPTSPSPSTTDSSSSSQPILPEASVSQQVIPTAPEQSLLTGLSDLLHNQAEEQEHVINAALFGLGVSFMNGDPSSVFSPILQHQQRNYLDIEDLDVVVGEDGQVIPKNNQDPSFNFRKWLKGEQKKNKKRQMEGQSPLSNQIEVNVDEGIHYLIESAQRNFEPAQLSLAHIYLYVLKNETVGLNWLHVAVQHNKSSQALMQLAEYHFTVKNEAEKAAQYYKKASEVGNADADYYLGYMYCAGVGVEQNVQTGIQYLEKAGKAQQSEALLYLAQLYQTGDGVPQDFEKMVQYLNASAKLGNSEALFQLGFLHYSGEAGFQIDYPQALKYFKAAARSSQGHSNAFLNEGVMYYNGLGTEADYEKAFYAYQNAVSVDPNNIAALYNLANMFQEGHGVTKNPGQAEHYFNRAKKLEEQQSQ